MCDLLPFSKKRTLADNTLAATFFSLDTTFSIVATFNRISLKAQIQTASEAGALKKPAPGR